MGNSSQTFLLKDGNSAWSGGSGSSRCVHICTLPADIIPDYSWLAISQSKLIVSKFNTYSSNWVETVGRCFGTNSPAPLISVIPMEMSRRSLEWLWPTTCLFVRELGETHALSKYQSLSHRPHNFEVRHTTLYNDLDFLNYLSVSIYIYTYIYIYICIYIYV